MEREMLQASVGSNIYEELKKSWQEESKSLQESLEAWKEPEGLTAVCSNYRNCGAGKINAFAKLYDENSVQR